MDTYSYWYFIMYLMSYRYFLQGLTGGFPLIHRQGSLGVDLGLVEAVVGPAGAGALTRPGASINSPVQGAVDWR